MELNERQRQIVEMISALGMVSINDLSERFGVATQTIRRDINELCGEGLARRVHGGVEPPKNPVNLNYRARQILNEDAKRRIGQAAARMIPDGATVLLGIGTTVQFVAEALLNRRDLAIVTNNIEVAGLLCNGPGLDVFMVGGSLRPEDRDIVGPEAIAGYESFVADVAVIGAGALDPDHGILDHKRFDALLSQVLIARAREAILVADVSKWEKQAAHRVGAIGSVGHFVTDSVPAEVAAFPRQLGTAALTVIE